MLYELKCLAAKIKGGKTTAEDIPSNSKAGVLEYICSNWSAVSVSKVDTTVESVDDGNKLTIKLTMSDGTTRQSTVTIPKEGGGLWLMRITHIIQALTAEA